MSRLVKPLVGLTVCLIFIRIQIESMQALIVSTGGVSTLLHTHCTKLTRRRWSSLVRWKKVKYITCIVFLSFIGSTVHRVGRWIAPGTTCM